MKIKKSWLVQYNGDSTVVVKTKEGYFLMQTTNITGFVKFNCGLKFCGCKDE